MSIPASPTTDSKARRFIITTPGLSASRWLAFVLNSHPGVFIAHGHFPLDSVLRGDFQREKEKGDVESLTIGTEMADFYRTRPLNEVFRAYRPLKPGAQAYGNIHSYTIAALIRCIRDPNELDGITVANVLRHPVSYIDSHSSLVRSAERHPRLYAHYLENLFTTALREFPELFLIDCPDYREFVGFTVSCMSVCGMADDFTHSQFKHFRMESLISDAEILKSFCQTMTGLVYPLIQIQSFIREGAINRHRENGANADAQSISDSWPAWKRDIALMMIPESVLDKFETEGYDIRMLRVEGLARRGNVRSEKVTDSPKAGVPCLADSLRRMNGRHPLLALLAPAKESKANQEAPNKVLWPPRLIEQHRGYNVVLFKESVYGVCQSLGHVDLDALDDTKIAEYSEDDFIVGGSVDGVKARIDFVVLSRLLQGLSAKLTSLSIENVDRIERRIAGFENSMVEVQSRILDQAAQAASQTICEVASNLRTDFSVRLAELAHGLEHEREQSRALLRNVEQQVTESWQQSIRELAEEREQRELVIWTVEEQVAESHRHALQVNGTVEELQAKVSEIGDRVSRAVALLNELCYGPGDPQTSRVIEHYRGFRLVLEQGEILSVPEGSEGNKAMFESSPLMPELMKARIDAYMAERAVALLEARLSNSGFRAALRKLLRRDSENVKREV